MTAIISQQAPGLALAGIFSSRARVVILRVFMLDPFRAYYQRQIETATGLLIRAVQRELDRLTSIGLLCRRSEGNRTYYQVDTQFPLFPELRSMVLKTVGPEERLRGLLAVDASVRLAFLCALEARVLIVTTGNQPPNLTEPGPFSYEIMALEEFVGVLSTHPEALHPFLVAGVDLLGRREDMTWRRIEAAGFKVPKDKGVP